MRVGLFHNRYAQRGGEDAAFDLEVELLRKAGCEVHPFTVDNGELQGPLAALRTALSARSSSRMASRVARFVARHAIDVGHVHNFFPLLTPAVHETLFELGVPIVQTLHNYRLACAQGGFLRDGKNCEDCVSRGPWNAVRHGCWRNSRLATAVWADTTRVHRRRGTWQRVDRFLAPSEFARRKLVEVGLPADRTLVLPDAVADAGVAAAPGRGAVAVGRLSPEKGVALLIDAWRQLPDVPLRIVGGGPEAAQLERRAAGLANVSFIGEQPHERVIEEIARAAFLVAPSLCYETFGLAGAEALAAGRPVVVPRGSALEELAAGGRCGVLFAAGNAASLAAACRELAHDAERCAALGTEARSHFDEALAPERRTQDLLAVYRSLVSGRSMRQCHQVET
jgi:glycosyltransferase involved in cell wall biosynthesis